MKNFKKFLTLGFALLMVMAMVVSCTKPAVDTTPTPATEDSADTTTGTITLAGSTTVQPLAEKFAEAYMAEHAGVRIDVQGGGSSVGVKAAGEQTANIGMASRDVKDSEFTDFPEIKVFVIARDGIALVAHEDVAVDDLTIEQIQGIFGGTITNWKEVGGADAGIIVVSREEGSGTRAAFEEMVLGEDVLIADTAILQPSNGSIRTTVSTTPHSIGYLSFGYLDDTVKAVKVEGVAPTEPNAADGSYPVVRPLNMITYGEPTGEVKSFLDFMLSEAGQAIVVEEGYISVLPVAEAAEEVVEEGLSGTVTLAGSTTVQPLAEKFAEAFMAANAKVEITVQGGGSSVGVKAAADGTANIGMASRDVKDSEMTEFPDLNVFVIARDGIAIVVNEDVAVADLTIDQIKGIFGGTITNWKEVGGEDKAIIVVSREEGSGTRAAFEEMVLGDDVLITDTAILQPSNGSVRTTVSTTPDSIGYLSFGYLDETTKAVAVEGVEPTEENASDGSYPIVRPLNMITKGAPEGVVKAFLDYILSEEGQAIVSEEGYISVLEKPLSGTVTLAGSTTVQPLAEMFAEAFMAANPDVVITVQGGGSSVGVKAAAGGTADIGMASREVKDSEMTEFPELNVFVIARDGIAIVASPDLAVDDLTIDQIKGIFGGTITNWKEVGGADAAIIVVSREEGSGTRAAFEEMVLGEDVLITDTAILQPSNGSVRTTVSTTPNSIGYLSFGYLDESVKALMVEGVAPTEENAANGTYAIVRPLNMITNGAPKGVVKAFLNFILSAEGQAIVSEEGYIAVK